MTPCQVLTRAPRKKGDTGRTFFSLPVDRSADGDVEEFCKVNVKNLKRVWSSFQGPQGETWLLWCRLDPGKTSVTIRQCVVENTPDDKGQYWTWSRKSEVESISKKIGARHTVSNLTFTIADITVTDQNPLIAWVNIADPEIQMSAPAK